MRANTWIILATSVLGGCSFLSIDQPEGSQDTHLEAVTPFVNATGAPGREVKDRLDGPAMIAVCQSRFHAALGDLDVVYPNGPTIVRDGDVVTVALEAEPMDRTMLDPKHYVCVFDAGALSSAQATD